MLQLGFIFKQFNYQSDIFPYLLNLIYNCNIARTRSHENFELNRSQVRNGIFGNVQLIKTIVSKQLDDVAKDITKANFEFNQFLEYLIFDKEVEVALEICLATYFDSLKCQQSKYLSCSNGLMIWNLIYLQALYLYQNE